MATIASLQELSLNALAKDSISMWTQAPGGQGDLLWKDRDLVLPCADEFLNKLCDTRKMNMKIMSMFQTRHTCLTHVRIPNASQIGLTAEGLKTLGSHRLSSCDIRGCVDLWLEDILSGLGPEAGNTLRSLKLANVQWRQTPYRFPLEGGLPREIFSKLVNLSVLCFVDMGLSDQTLAVIANTLPKLQCLDVSENDYLRDISPLNNCKELKVLTMHSCQHLERDGTVATLRGMQYLEHLDVSLNESRFRATRFSFKFEFRECTTDLESEFPVFCAAALLEDPSFNQNLVSLDLSGRGTASERIFSAYLDAHPSIQYLGLFKSPMCHFAMFDPLASNFRPDIEVSGDSSLSQFLSALKRYDQLKRGNYVDNILMTLYRKLDEDRNLSFKTNKDAILRTLMDLIPSHYHRSLYSRAIRTEQIMQCLELLLLKHHVSPIEPDTRRRLLEVCDYVRDNCPPPPPRFFSLGQSLVADSAAEIVFFVRHLADESDGDTDDF